MAVKRYKPNAEKAKEVASNPTSYSNDGLKFVYPFTEGDYKFRILPPWDEKGLIGLIVGKHVIPGTDGNNIKHVCVESTFPGMDTDCPICNVLRKYRDHGLDVDKYDVRPKAYFNAILLDAPEEFFKESNGKTKKGDTVIFIHTTTTYDWLWNLIDDEDVGDVTDPENGFDIKIKRYKEKGNVRYDRTVVPKSRPIAETEEEINNILDNIQNLNQIWSQPDDEIFNNIKNDANRLDNILASKVQSANQAVTSSTTDEVGSIAGTNTPPPPPASSGSDPSDNTKVWWTKDGDPVEGTLADVKAHVKAGADVNVIQVMPHDQSEGWKSASEWGVGTTEELNS